MSINAGTMTLYKNNSITFKKKTDKKTTVEVTILLLYLHIFPTFTSYFKEILYCRDFIDIHFRETSLFLQKLVWKKLIIKG